VAETHEPSYYEIALTNRQVVVAFVILLTCLVAAFFSGVWIGREATARAAQEQIVRNAPPPQDAEGKNLEELEFFDPKAKKDHKDHKKEAAAGEASAASQDAVEKPVPGASQPFQPSQSSQPTQPPKKTTLADELAGRRTGTTAKPAPPQPVAETPAAAAPAPTPKRAVPAPVAADEAAEEAPVPVPRKTAKAHDKTAAAAAGKGAYVIQVFSSADKAQADRIRAKLAGGGQKAFLSPIERGGRTMYRVRVGPFKSHDDAQKVADKVRKAYRLDTWVTE
jgi:DedD protein